MKSYKTFIVNNEKITKKISMKKSTAFIFTTLLVVIIFLGIYFVIKNIIFSNKNTSPSDLVSQSIESEELKIDNLQWKDVQYDSSNFIATVTVPEIWHEEIYIGEPIEKQHLWGITGSIGHPNMRVRLQLRFYLNNSTFDQWINEHKLEFRYPVSFTEHFKNGQQFVIITNTENRGNIYYYTPVIGGVIEFIFLEDFIQDTNLINISQSRFPSYFQLRPKIIESFHVLNK